MPFGVGILPHMEALPSDRGGGVKQRRLSCLGCGLAAKGNASGWRIYLDDKDQPVVYCPGCAEREFGSE